MAIEHPLWNKSKLPPSVLDKINNVPPHMRAMVIAELREKYEASLADLSAIGKRIAVQWEFGQSRHLEQVISELQAISELETAGSTVLGSGVYIDPAR
tara:strand:+ start:166 stop:459 length:294 start_codon:yes stop_codon:yes gene_type:complete